MSGDPAAETRPLNRILVVKLADLGDAVLATSAIGALRQSFPRARIDVLTGGSGAAVFRLCPAVDQVVVVNKHAFDRMTGLVQPTNALSLAGVLFRLRRQRYDAIVLLHHLTTPFGAAKFRWLCRTIGAPISAGLDNGRGDFLSHRAPDLGFGARSMHRYGLEVISLLGANAAGAHPMITIPDSTRESAKSILRSRGVLGDYVVIHPSVGEYSQARNWFPERFAAVARSIVDQFGVSIVLVGAGEASSAAEEICRQVDAVDLTRATSIAELAAVLEGAALVLGADSGVVHLAAALDRPTIAIFGPSNAGEWLPIASNLVNVDAESLPAGRSFAVRANIPCSPCFYTGYSLGRREGCSIRTCLRLVRPELIAQIAARVLAQNGVAHSATE